jgi:hypothetical protein
LVAADVIEIEAERAAVRRLENAAAAASGVAVAAAQAAAVAASSLRTRSPGPSSRSLRMFARRSALVTSCP